MRTQNLSSSTMGKSFHTLGVSNALHQISSQSNAVLRLMDDQCDLDPSGRLVVPGAHSSPSNHQSTPLGNTDTTEYAAGGDYDGDDDDDGPGFVMADDDDRDYSSGPAGGLDVPETAKKRVTFAVESRPEKEASWDRPDPWAVLDPHTSDSRRARPIRVGKTLKLPAGITDLPSECVTGSRTKKWKAPVPVPKAEVPEPTFFATQTFQALSRKRRMEEDDESDNEEDKEASDDTNDIFSMIPSKGLVYGEEFAYLA
jgi:hypothetical protein